ncbi:unnamed protein product [Darwinula stevensoni]|uniref:Uncharacterized protein n=1 Tax=Darwinula stevensoni TaxID=69355 RepID=A0A7R9A525_9CRUS|nr:unnamed protein product [Darwinula stevensoni]CAG0894734.1 unnamed protein product [Darwinula stevensoni]
MSVIGIDFGNESCYIAVARAGGIETITNDYSLRATPSCVAFGENTRILGVAAKNQMVTNMKNTIWGFKKLLGRSFRSPLVQKEVQAFPFPVIEMPDGSIGVRVYYGGEEQTFSIQQVTAMLFTKLKEIAEAALHTKVCDCVISVPSYFTDAERHALLDAAAIAGFNVLRILNEPAAVGLAYGIYHQDLPPPEEKPRNVIFIDCGQSTTQVAVCAFNKGKLKMLSCLADPNLGGRDFDNELALHFAADFKKRYNIDPMNDKRAWLRLLTEVEKLKKQMSANSNELPMNIECFMEEKDVSARMKRADFEKLTENLLRRVHHLMRSCLQDSGLRVEDVHSVEIVGGSSRIPAIKQSIQETFRKPPSTTLNQDEAVSRGCALQCAMLSPAFKVRDFSISDVQMYPITLKWLGPDSEDGEMEVFPVNHQVPFSKMLTFYRKEPFTLQAVYSGNIPYHNPVIGEFKIDNITPTAEGESPKIKVKVRVNMNGVFKVASASLVEKKGAEEMEQDAASPSAMEETEDGKTPKSNTTVPNTNAASDDSQKNGPVGENDVPMDEKNDKQDQEKPNHMDGNGAEEGETKPERKGKKAKLVLKTVDLPITSTVCQLSKDVINDLVERESKMVMHDRQEKERIDARNAVEEYVYEMRNRISDDLQEFIASNDREKFMQFLDETENWLYDEGENCKKSVYVTRRQDLQKHGDPVVARKKEFDERPLCFDQLGGGLQQVRKALDLFAQGDEKYNHIDAEDMKKVEKALQEKEAWLDKAFNSLSNLPKEKNPPILAQQIRAEKQALDNVVMPILNKPKPKVEPPPAPKSEGGEAPSAESPASEAPDGASAASSKMDVDQ